MFSPLPLWGYTLIAVIMIHVTVQGVSIYLHRHQTHRSIGVMHPVLSHFYRAWLFFTTGMVTKEWVAVHRKHHAVTDKPGDPHSPKLAGFLKVLFLGAYLYRRAAKDQEIIQQFGAGTPDDWIERNVYSQYSLLGPLAMLGLDLLCFRAPGFWIWVAQMIAIPGLAAGVINGIGHAWGYRNYDTFDVSKNIVPIGLIACGEELHNNHHAAQWSAKFSFRRWELDMGWGYIVLFRKLKLVKNVRRAQKKHLMQIQ